MTDATTGPAAEGAEAEDRTNRTTVTPTPREVTEEADHGAGHEGTAPGRPTGTPGTAAATPTTTPTSGRLLPHDECDKLELRLRQAVSGFVDGPRNSVEEADHVVEEIAGQFTEALTRRRRTLRMSWQDGEDTEQLRLALRDYRNLAERLLHG
ncbi:hypothetical protein [Streptomyces sp. TLI_185]|uniref:hypothetical protein n=1 Tax=Streptomyces sp. TLI_185 TaxID=2485151 RepID=UPI000F4FFE74|nr:hypothetical protein [Streptomyces sp. TLI_185]RPF33129.1 hypothetical protein EDD92_3030 [Streptomyces sp. TLI_185]